MIQRPRGFSKLEFAVVVTVFGILAHLLLARLTALEHDTERLAVDLTVRHINVGLRLAVGERIMRGEEARIPALLATNPLDYLGREVGAGGTADAWQYDAPTRTLSYRPRQPDAFAGRSELAWRLTGHVDEFGRTVGLRLEALK